MREPQGRAFLQRSGREEPQGRGKSPTLGLRAAPATIGKAPCNRERSPHLDELMTEASSQASLGGVPRHARERGWENPRKLYRTACGPEHCWFAEQTVGFAAETIRSCSSISPLASARPRCPCPTASVTHTGSSQAGTGGLSCRLSEHKKKEGRMTKSDTLKLPKRIAGVKVPRFCAGQA